MIKITFLVQVELPNQGQYQQMITQLTSFDEIFLLYLVENKGDKILEFLVVYLHFGDRNTIDEENEVLDGLAI